MDQLPWKRIILFLFCIVNHNITHGGHILILTTPLYSVIKPLIPTIDLLHHKYGHTTTVAMSTELAKSTMVKNSTIDVVIWKKYDSRNVSAMMPAEIKRSLKGGMPYGVGYDRTIGGLCERLLSDNDLYRDVESKPIKMVVVASGAYAMCWNVIPYKLSIPFILYGQNYDPVNERIPYSSSFIPANPFVAFTDKMNFFERTINFILFSLYTLVEDVVSPWGVVAKYAPKKPYISIPDLRKQSELYLFEYDVLMDYPRPMFPNCVSIGGIGTSPAMPLEEKIKLFMNSANDGAIIVSFGSLVTSLPNSVISKFIATFKKLAPRKILLKHDGLSQVSENILVIPWIPQNDLLGHENTRLFITHCGNGGQYEALYHGVPMIGFPLFSEQYTNARRMEDKGFGIAVEISDFTETELLHKINEVLKNKKYKMAIGKASEIFKGRPDTPDQRMAYWIDHVMKYGGKYMRPSSLDLPFYQYYMLDILLVFFIIFGVLFLCIKNLCTRSVKYFKTKTD